ncbi:MAG: bifunctional methionine sulfoxide reductase B/A protein [Phycisphaerae bacterium]
MPRRRRNISSMGYDIRPLSAARLAELSARLTPEERDVILNQGTEPRFCGNLLKNRRAGVYTCRLCDLPLFKSKAKFESHSGWPSFVEPIDRDHILERRDTSHDMVRTEIICGRCEGHLGHVFDDGPPPTCKRYCLNSVAMSFYSETTPLPGGAMPADTDTAYFAAGCFWGIEDRFQNIPGVIDAASGYQGGTTVNPTYEDVCRGDTGHAEAVRVIFDPNQVSYSSLVEAFFAMHSPVASERKKRQAGGQYRSAIFARDGRQQAIAESVFERVAGSERFAKESLATVIEPAEIFWEAEERHQDYHQKHGRRPDGCSLN